jgi:hypothetical protein
MDITKSDTALVVIDPQNDVLSEKGANWGAVGASVTENKTVQNMERIFKAAKANGYEVFISPHYFYPTDSGWAFNGPLEADEFRTLCFARSRLAAAISRARADWLVFKPYIEDGRRCGQPHKVWGRRPRRSQLLAGHRQVGILGGMLATSASRPICAICSSRAPGGGGQGRHHGPRHPEWATSYRRWSFWFLAHAVLSTDKPSRPCAERNQGAAPAGDEGDLRQCRLPHAGGRQGGLDRISRHRSPVDRLAALDHGDGQADLSVMAARRDSVYPAQHYAGGGAS